MDSRFTDRRRFWSLILFLSLTFASPVLAVEITFDEIAGQTIDLHVCGVVVSGSDDVLTDAGLGIAGGFGTSMVDGTEWIEFEFDAPQLGVQIDVIDALDIDGDGISGRMLVEAFDATGASMGFQLIQEAGTKDLAAIYGGASMSRFVMTALGDASRITRLGYDETGAVEIDLVGGGYVDLAYPAPTICGVRFVGSSQIYFVDGQSGGNAGMGVVGGEDALMLDGSEWMRLEFPYPVDELVLESLLFGLDADFFYGEAVLFAYDDLGQSLGSMSLQRHSLFGGPVAQTVDVVTALGAGGIKEIEILSLGDGRRLDRVIYAPEPSMGTGAALISLAAFARRRSRKVAAGA
ncbi:MAG: hypothetical protein NXI30_26835 [bacterium]|nr:hypothetical protein [bacterium]